jgi:hypothetical protein
LIAPAPPVTGSLTLILVPGIVKLLNVVVPLGVGVVGVVLGTVAPGAVVGVDAVGVVGTVTVVVGTAGVVGVDAVAGTVTVAGGGVDSGVSSSVTSASAIPAANRASSTHVMTIGSRQLGGGCTRVRAARPHSRHQP